MRKTQVFGRFLKKTSKTLGCLDTFFLKILLTPWFLNRFS